MLVDSRFASSRSLIPPGDLLVLNTTRVRHARLLGTRPSGAPAEVLLIHPGTGRHLGRDGQAGQRAAARASGSRSATASASRPIEVLPDGHRLVRFLGAAAEDAIARFGRLPLPPYITRDPTELDEERYQTVYARAEGSVAAPTAGLHFTPGDPRRAVRQRGADRRARPPGRARAPSSRSRWTTRREHPMHPERYEISPRLAALVEVVREQGGQRVGGRDDGGAGARERGGRATGWFARARARPAC